MKSEELCPPSPDMEDRSVNEFGLGFKVWLWGPKSGALGGSSSEGGISIAPVYSVIDIKKRGTGKPDDAEKRPPTVPT